MVLDGRKRLGKFSKFFKKLKIKNIGPRP